MKEKETLYDDFVWQISDPIHGSIKVTKLEAEIIDSRPFQRLRKIKQLGNVHLVFPGAVHSRFTHSLGVMHIAGKMFDALFGSAKPDALQQESVKELRMLVRLAGLLHDIGHGPFSHTFEACLKHKENGILVPSAVKDLDESLKIPEHWISEQVREDYFELPLQHEHYSFGLIRSIFSKIEKLQNIGHAVCSLLDERIISSDKTTKLFENIAATVFNGADPHSLRRCIKSILSGELDADRLDYLQRDAFYCGVGIAGVDAEYVLSSISLSERRRNVRGKSEKREIYIAINKSAVPAFEQVLISRKQMYDRVYHHRVNSGFDYMLEYLMDYLINDEKSNVKLPRTADAFLIMTDEWLESHIIQLATSEKRLPIDVRLAAQLFITRSPLKKIEEEDIKDNEVEKKKTDFENYYNNGKKQSDKKHIFAKKLPKLTKMPRETSSSEDALIMVKSQLANDSPRNLSDESGVLSSNAWRDIKSRIFVFESFKKTAVLRKVSSKL